MCVALAPSSGRISTLSDRTSPLASSGRQRTANNRPPRTYRHRDRQAIYKSLSASATGLRAGNFVPIGAAKLQVAWISRARCRRPETDGKSRAFGSRSPVELSGRYHLRYRIFRAVQPRGQPEPSWSAHGQPPKNRKLPPRREGGRGGHTKQQGPTMRSDKAGRKFFSNSPSPAHREKRAGGFGFSNRGNER